MDSSSQESIKDFIILNNTNYSKIVQSHDLKNEGTKLYIK